MQNVHAAGAVIPALGFGTYGMDSRAMQRLLPAALRASFRHIDTAQIYGNEADVGECVAASGIARADVFITTKVWVANYHPRKFEDSVDASLARLRTDYIDLLLLHWPNSDVPLAEQVGGLNAVVKAGKVRHTGISNFNRMLMAEAIRLSDNPLVTNQFEYHPYLNQSALIESTRHAGLSVTAYCGMAVGRVFSDDVLKEIAMRATGKQSLRWFCVGSFNRMASWHYRGPQRRNGWSRMQPSSTSG